MIKIHGEEWELVVEVESCGHAISVFSTRRRAYEIATSRASLSEEVILVMRVSRL